MMEIGTLKRRYTIEPVRFPVERKKHRRPPQREPQRRAPTRVKTTV
jgi:hypothetical protein